MGGGICRKKRSLDRRKFRVRLKVRGTAMRPRLSVFRSNAHVYAQIINDADGHTLVSASSRDPQLQESLKSGGTKESAKEVGLVLAKRAQSLGITAVVFDRGGRLYHGRVKALADGSRDGGLIF